jgi:hypothetical protein
MWEPLPWVDYEALSGPKKALIWAVVVLIAILLATALWFLGFREAPDVASAVA